ncbi:hypothetical protein [Sphingobium tyrosinilyticum]|uniref:Uncharacterized protein n=1 Tax=Sphingobium tyrosinilyticum TaxID=2715436 RepID=A0ABV9F319_9SPHN
MTGQTHEDIQAIADTVVEMEEELEVSGYVTLEEAELLRLKTLLHEWVDSVAGVVATPALGRVTLIHRHGRKSSIASADLPFMLSTPAS